MIVGLGNELTVTSYTVGVVAVHPFPSVIVTVVEPACILVAVLPVCTGVVAHVYVYGIVPPDPITEAVPVPL